MISSDCGSPAAAILVREEATDRQIWITAVGIPINVTVLTSFQLGWKNLGLILIMERPDVYKRQGDVD